MPATAPPPSAGENSDAMLTSIKKAYSDFAATTPTVTRILCLLFPIMYILSYLIPVTYFATNCPVFVIFGLEIHRLVLSILVNDSLLGTIFTLISFHRSGVTLENKRGSMAFLVLILTLTLVANTIHDTFMFILSTVYSASFLMSCSKGFWITLFAILVIESMENPDAPRRVFFFNVPGRFYALALLAMFSLFMGFQWSLFAGIAAGYLYVYGYLNCLEVSKAGIKYLEGMTFLGGLTTATGFVSIDNAGSDSIPTTTPNSGGGGGGGSGWVSRGGGPIRPGGGATGGNTAAAPTTTPAVKISSTFSGQGNVLGSSGNSNTTASVSKDESRDARNKALQKRLDAEREAQENARFDADTARSMGNGMNLQPKTTFPYEKEERELVNLGFSPEKARKALAETKGNLDLAMDRLN